MQLAVILTAVGLLVANKLVFVGAERGKCAYRVTFGARHMSQEDKFQLCELGCFDRYQLHSDSSRATEGALFRRFRCCCADYQVDKVWK